MCAPYVDPADRVPHLSYDRKLHDTTVSGIRACVRGTRRSRVRVDDALVQCRGVVDVGQAAQRKVLGGAPGWFT